MALRTPLVIVNGQIEQLQPGDSINVPISGVIELGLTNDNGSSAVAGMAVYSSANDHFDLAEANAAGTKDVIGLVNEASISTGTSGQIATMGVMTLTTVQWDAVQTVPTGGLVFDTIYYLDPATPGFITSVAPTTSGQFVCQLGKALSSTELELNILHTVLL